MARAIWTGSIGFGLVNVPVGLYAATEDHTVHFRQFERGTTDRIRYRRVNEVSGEEVAYDDIVDGYDVGGGDYVLVEPEELEEVAPGRSRTIEITDFVEQAEIDPIHYQRSYFLAPADDAAVRPYGLLLRALRDADRVGIATFVLRNKQYLAAIRPRDDVLALETMWWADEIRNAADELDRLPAGESFAERELRMATSLIDSMTVAWDPSAYHDTYREKVEALLEARAEGRQVTPETPGDRGGEVVDLMEALERSLAAAGDRRKGGASSPGAQRQRSGKGGADDLAGLTKAELYERAQRLDVPGRSSMDRNALEAAVRKAS